MALDIIVILQSVRYILELMTGDCYLLKQVQKVGAYNIVLLLNCMKFELVRKVVFSYFVLTS